MEEKNIKSNKYSKIVIIILSILLIGALGFICYDKFINNEKPPVPTPASPATPTPKNNETIDETNTIEKISIDETTTLKEISISDYNVEVKIDFNGQDYLIQIRDGNLFINNKQIFDSNNEPTSAQIAYATNKYILFVAAAQDAGVISYAMDKNGNKLTVVDNDYQIHSLKFENGVLTAKGHIFCGIDCNCPDKNLTINYKNNTITVIPKN